MLYNYIWVSFDDEKPSRAVLRTAIEPATTVPEQASLRLKLLRVMQQGEQIDVWLAKMGGTRVVAKLIRIYETSPDHKERRAVDSLKKEFELYSTALRELQGVIIPRFLGLYTGTGRVTICMVLGSCVSAPAALTSTEEKA